MSVLLLGVVIVQPKQCSITISFHHNFSGNMTGFLATHSNDCSMIVFTVEALPHPVVLYWLYYIANNFSKTLYLLVILHDTEWQLL